MKCLCNNCHNEAEQTEDSPYMDEFCTDPCTLERHDLPYEGRASFTCGGQVALHLTYEELDALVWSMYVGDDVPPSKWDAYRSALEKAEAAL